MLRRTLIGYVAAVALTTGVVAGCSGVIGSHTEFNPGAPVEVRATQPTLKMAVGSQQTLTVAAYDNRGLEVPNIEVAWSVFNPAVASVDAAGLVKALTAGFTSVTATYKGMIARTDVEVTAGAVELSFNSDIKGLTVGCAGCHQASGPAGANTTGSLADLANLLSKNYVVPGNPAGSSFLTKGSGAGHSGGDVFGVNKQKVTDWIQQGAKP